MGNMGIKDNLVLREDLLRLLQRGATKVISGFPKSRDRLTTDNQRAHPHVIHPPPQAATVAT